MTGKIDCMWFHDRPAQWTKRPSGAALNVGTSPFSLTESLVSLRQIKRMMGGQDWECKTTMKMTHKENVKSQLSQLSPSSRHEPEKYLKTAHMSAFVHDLRSLAALYKSLFSVIQESSFAEIPQVITGVVAACHAVLT